MTNPQAFGQTVRNRAFQTLVIVISPACTFPPEVPADPSAETATSSDSAFVANSEEGEQGDGGGTDVVLDPGVCVELPLTGYHQGGYGFGDSVGGNRFHAGQDAHASAGTAVFSPWRGKVVWSGPGGTGWGGLVEVQVVFPDGEKAVLILGHLDPQSITVRVGDHVEPGDVLGKIGSTAVNGGWSPHLHFGVFVGALSSAVLRGHVTSADLASYVDPVRFLNRHGRGAGCGDETATVPSEKPATCSLSWSQQPSSITVGETTRGCFSATLGCGDLRVDLRRADGSLAAVVGAPVSSTCVDVTAFGDVLGGGLVLEVSTLNGSAASGSATSGAFSIAELPIQTPDPVTPAPSASASVSIDSDNSVERFGFAYTTNGATTWSSMRWLDSTAPCNALARGGTRCTIDFPPTGFDEVTFNLERGGGWACQASGLAAGVTVPQAIAIGVVPNGVGGFNCVARF